MLRRRRPSEHYRSPRSPGLSDKSTTAWLQASARLADGQCYSLCACADCHHHGPGLEAFYRRDLSSIRARTPRRVARRARMQRCKRVAAAASRARRYPRVGDVAPPRRAAQQRRVCVAQPLVMRRAASRSQGVEVMGAPHTAAARGARPPLPMRLRSPMHSVRAMRARARARHLSPPSPTFRPPYEEATATLRGGRPLYEEATATLRGGP